MEDNKVNLGGMCYAITEKNIYTIEDIYALPDNLHAELFKGRIYGMAAPNWIHQKVVMNLSALIHDYIKGQDGSGEVYPAPFAVSMQYEEYTNYFEPDISVICDKEKLVDEGCKGAPDFIIEVVSPSSREMDYVHKLDAYLTAGVREYWIVDPLKKHTTIYRFEEENLAPVIVPFEYDISVGIYKDLQINIAGLIE